MSDAQIQATGGWVSLAFTGFFYWLSKTTLQDWASIATIISALVTIGFQFYRNRKNKKRRS